MGDVTVLAGRGYGVDSVGPIVRLIAGNSALPMTWDVAIRMGVRMRVNCRNAFEFRRLSRTLEEANPEHQSTRHVAREHGVLVEGNYTVYDEGPDVVIDIRTPQARLTMEPTVARNYALWLVNEGKRVQSIFAPDMKLQFHAAQLTDGNVIDMREQSRRTATSAFV